MPRAVVSGERTPSDVRSRAEVVEGARSGPDLTWPRLLGLCLAVVFLGAAIAYFALGRPDRGGVVEVGFVQDMTSHHDQAIEIATLGLQDGADDVVRSFALEALIFQNRELGAMNELLADRGLAPEDRPATAMGWMDMAPVAVADMAGMATQAELDDLEAASGADADARYLEIMLDHHLGGLHMSDYAAEHAESERIRDFATQVARNQAFEVNEMIYAANRLGLDLDVDPVEVPDRAD